MAKNGLTTHDITATNSALNSRFKRTHNNYAEDVNEAADEALSGDRIAVMYDNAIKPSPTVIIVSSLGRFNWSVCISHPVLCVGAQLATICVSMIIVILAVNLSGGECLFASYNTVRCSVLPLKDRSEPEYT